MEGSHSLKFCYGRCILNGDPRHAFLKSFIARSYFEKRKSIYYIFFVSSYHFKQFKIFFCIISLYLPIGISIRRDYAKNSQDFL